MLFLLFHLGTERYALATGQVVEVLPLVSIRRIPQVPSGVAGVFDYHGAVVPVMDLSEVMLGRSAPPRLSTRIIVVHYPDQRAEPRLLGLIAEKVTETMRREATDFSPSRIANGNASYLGPLTTDERGLVQRIEVNQLLPAAVRDVLFQAAADS